MFPTVSQFHLPIMMKRPELSKSLRGKHIKSHKESLHFHQPNN